MTLILWKAPVVDDPDEAKALLDALVRARMMKSGVRAEQ